MKFYLIVLFAFVAVAQAGFPPFGHRYYELKSENFIDKLIRAGLEAVRKMLKDHEPFEVPDIPTQHFVDPDKAIDITVELQQVKVSKASDFTVDHIENNLPGLWAKFGVTVPKMHLQGSYKVSGTVAQKKISGQGTFEADLDTMVQTGTIYMAMVDHAMQMKQLDLDYDLKGLKFNMIGLSIEGMTKDQVEDVLNRQFFDYLQTHKQDVCGIVSKQVMIAANKIMQGKTLKQLLDWLKDFISH